MIPESQRRQILTFGEEVASRLGTKHTLRRGVDGRPRPAFLAGRYWVELEHRIPERNRPWYHTSFTLDPAGTLGEVRLEVYPEYPGDFVIKFIGMQDIEIGDPRFDPAFIVKGTLEPQRVAVVIDAEMRRYLGEVRDQQPLISAGPQKVSFSLRELILADRPLRAMVALVTSITDRLQAPGPPVVEFVPEAAATATTTRLEKPVPTCRICGRTLTLFVIRCARCERPHHLECWDYAGVCSTFACGSTQRV